MVRPLPVVALLVAAGLAGCLSGTDTASIGEAPDRPLNLTEIRERLSEAIYEEIQRTEHVVEGQGDTEIWLDLYRPANADETVPVILVMTPYQVFADATAPLAWQSGTCDAPDPDDCPYSPWLVDTFAPRGYAVAFADVRGNHNSGGCIDQSGPDQWRDGYNVVEWLGTRDWSNGKVGMYGASYDGETQITTALLDPPHLETIVPTASVSTQYGYIHDDGVPYELQGASTMAGYLAISAAPGDDPTALTSYHERWTCQPENLRHGLDRSGDWNRYWEARDYRRLADQVNASILQVHGLQDWNVKPDHVAEIWQRYDTTKRLVLGQWDHAYPDSYCGVNETLCRGDWQRIVHRWFDRELKGIATGILEDLPPVLTQDDAGDWRGIETFPPAPDPDRALYLTGNRTLSTAAPDEGALDLRDWPREDGCDGQILATLPCPGETAERVTTRAATRPARLVFETAPLDDPLRYTGRPVLELAATTDAASTHWVVHLIEVDEDGSATWIDRGYADTRHRHGVDDPEPLSPGQRYEMNVTLYPQDDVIEPGHKLRLVLTNDDDWVHQDDTYATTTVHLGPDGTRLVLPPAPGGTPVPDDALRAGLAG